MQKCRADDVIDTLARQKKWTIIEYVHRICHPVTPTPLLCRTAPEWFLRTADLKMTHSLLYKEKIREGGYRKDRVITFNWDENELTYVSNNKKPKPLSVLPGTFDPLAAFYFIRLQPLTTVKKIERPITDGKKNVMGSVNVLGRETIRVGDRTYKTVVLEPILEDVELFSSNENAGIRVWITADERKIPVLVESRVAYGVFRAQLRKIEHVAQPEKQ